MKSSGRVARVVLVLVTGTACSSQTSGESTVDDEAAKRIDPSGPAQTAVLEVRAPGAPPYTPFALAVDGAGIVVGTPVALAPGEHLLVMRDQTLGETHEKVLLTAGQTTVIDLAEVQIALKYTDVDFGRRPVGVVSWFEDDERAIAASNLTGNGSWHGWALPGKYRLPLDFGANVGWMGDEFQTSAAVHAGPNSVFVTDKDVRTTFDVQEDAAVFPDATPGPVRLAPHLIAAKNLQPVFRAADDDFIGDSPLPLYDLDVKTGSYRAFALSRAERDFTHRFFLVASGFVEPLTAAPAAQVPVRIARIDVDDVEVMTGATSSRKKGTWRVEKQASSGTSGSPPIWVPQEYFQNGQRLTLELPTHTGIWVPPGHYRVTAMYRGPEGFVTRAYEIDP